MIWVNSDKIQTNAADALRALIDYINVSYNEDEKQHYVEIVGELSALLRLGGQENAAEVVSAASSLKLVAGD